MKRSQMELFMKSKTEIDIIILSFAQNEELKLITEQCISSLIASENKEESNLMWWLSNHRKNEPFQYPGTTTIIRRRVWLPSLYEYGNRNDFLEIYLSV